MENSIYVGLSRQSALRRELALVANNIANINTTSFKRELGIYSAAPTNTAGSGRLDFVIDHGSSISFEPGSIKNTGNDFDIAIRGPGFITIDDGEGIKYSRNGSLSLSADNQLITRDGDGVVDDLFGAMDVRGMSAAKASVSFEYNPEEKVDPNEPPERAALRKARHERNRQRIEAALKEKRARETAARQEQSERQMLKDLIGADIDAWQKKNQNNIRTMLANLADVLWEGHRYKSPDMGALMQPVGVKKCYHRALVVIHPDKVSQAGGDMSQRYIADKVFDIVKVAYKEFEAKELK